MKIAHWTLKNGSGMHRVAEDMAAGERTLGHESVVQKSDVVEDWEGGMGADIHVAHSHAPDKVRAEGGAVVWVGHGTPEHCFQTSVEEGLGGGYAPSDSFMLAQYWLQNADALVTFWPRHKQIWQSLCSKGRTVHCVPLGVNTNFWKPVDSNGKFAGNPSLLTAENCHYIKWPLDLVTMFPWVAEKVQDARLHMSYLPMDQHRWWYPLMYNNGAAFKTFFGGVFDHNGLRNAFVSVDYYVGLVRYGDYNRISLEASATGCKVISFRGNPYADYWLTEGDQRIQADELTAILKGETEPNETQKVPDIMDMAKAMVEIYESL